MPQGPYLRKYGTMATVDFTLFEVDGVDFRVDASHVTGDTKIMKDEGAEANTANAFVDEGQGYSLTLTSTETQAARIVVYVVDTTSTKVWLDTSLVIETYGHASAMHAFDLDTTTQDVNVETITSTASNTVADHTIRRTAANARASSDGDTLNFRSLLGAISKQTNKIEASGGTLTIYEENDTTSFGTQTITTDSGADPITALDTT